MCAALHCRVTALKWQGATIFIAKVNSVQHTHLFHLFLLFELCWHVNLNNYLESWLETSCFFSFNMSSYILLVLLLLPFTQGIADRVIRLKVSGWIDLLLKSSNLIRWLWLSWGGGRQYWWQCGRVLGRLPSRFICLSLRLGLVWISSGGCGNSVW